MNKFSLALLKFSNEYFMIDASAYRQYPNGRTKEFNDLLALAAKCVERMNYHYNNTMPYVEENVLNDTRKLFMMLIGARDKYQEGTIGYNVLNSLADVVYDFDKEFKSLMLQTAFEEMCY